MDKIPKRMVFYEFHLVMVTMERIEQSNQDRCRAKVKNDDYRIQCPERRGIITIRSRLLQRHGC